VKKISPLTAAAFLAATLGLSAPSGTIRVGYCGPLKDIDAAKAAGFDYFEVRTSEVAVLSDADFDQVASKLKRLAFPVPAAYWFVPAEIKVTGPDVDIDRQTAYLRKALDRDAQLGVRVIVFGSSGARNVPEGFPREKALQQLIEFGKRAGSEAQARQITIAIEPQRHQESNIINSTAEGLAWVRAVNHPNVQLMIDYYHFALENEDAAIVPTVRDHLRHLHMANPNNRVMPLSLNEYNYAPFFTALRQIRYSGLIGLEASSTNLQADGPRSVPLLKRSLQ
jgi:D-psicose/D-tagatose/L-ribulose 3-epimerase